MTIKIRHDCAESTDAAFSDLLRALVVFVLGATVFAAGGVAIAQNKSATEEVSGVQNASNPKLSNEPLFHDYKGVSIGTSTDQARLKLGDPQEKSALQEFFVFSDTESVQVYYDSDQKVRAISINFIGTKSGAPTALSVLGTQVEANADGSIHKLVRYPEAGYWVSYSQTAGGTPLITVTMQKIE